MQKFVVMLVVVALALCAGAAWSYPTVQGASGIVTLPTASVAPANTLNLAVDYTKTSPETLLGQTLEIYNEDTGLFEEADLGDTTSWPIRVNYGFANVAEISGGYNLLDGDFVDGNIWNVGAKYAFLTEAKDGFDLAVGGSFGKMDLLDESDIDAFDQTTAYLALGKTLMPCEQGQPVVKGTVGVMWMKIKNDDIDIDEDLIQPYLGLEVGFMKNFSVGVEYRFKDDDIDDKAPFSAVARYQFDTMPLWIEAGWSNAILYNGIGAGDGDFFVGLGYAFDGK